MNIAFIQPGPQYPMMVYSPTPHRLGYLGDDSSDDDSGFGQKLTSGVITGGTVGYQTAVATGSSVAGAVAGGLEAAAPFTGPAAPFLEALASIVGPIASLFSGCGQTCIQAANCSDTISQAAQQVITAYWGQTVRYVSTQQAAIKSLNQIAAWLGQCLQNPALGKVGQQYYNERLVRGTPASWCDHPNHVGCDFWSYYVDPITNDTGVVPDPAPTVNANGSVVSSSGSGLPMPLLVGGGVIALLLLGSISGGNS